MQQPINIDIENVRGLCNAKCPMCNLQMQDFETAIMSDDLFSEIIQRFKSNISDIKQCNFVGMGETLIDRGIVEKIKRGKQLGLQYITIVTNGSLLKIDLAENILNAGCDEILISIDSIHKSVYENIRVGLIFEDVMTNVLNLIKLRDQGNYKTRIIVRMITQDLNNDEWPEYEKFWKTHLNHQTGDMILWFPIHEWPNARLSEQNDHAVCPYIFDRMTINVYGEIQFCCVDVFADFYKLGSILNQEPIRVFNNEIFSKAREQMKQGLWNDLEYCYRCNVPLQRAKRGGVTV